MQGLDPRKFTVTRTDPEAQARHNACDLFVLDLDHDPHAWPALLAYAHAVRNSNPALAADLFAKLLKITRRNDAPRS